MEAVSIFDSANPVSGIVIVFAIGNRWLLDIYCFLMICDSREFSVTEIKNIPNFANYYSLS